MAGARGHGRRTRVEPVQPALVVHGGAWEIPDALVAACRRGCQRALEVGWAVLAGGGSALDAVVEAVAVLEDDPVFDAGYGAHLNLDGRVQLDAIVMDGERLDAGAVAAVERVRNPVRLARRVLEASPHVLLVGSGAERFAQEQGLELCAPEELITAEERAAWEQCRRLGHDAARHAGHGMGTVGAVALDHAGRLAAATSTGGTCCKYPGRVGDSPLIGCGCYADSLVGAASATGMGEAIMRVVLAREAVERMRTGTHPQEVAEACMRLLAERGRGRGGLILLDRQGRFGVAFSTSRMAFAFYDAAGGLVLGPAAD